MTALEFATETMQPAARPAFLARGINAVSQLVRSWKNRRAFYRLGDMSDAELADIGLTRGDLHVALGNGERPNLSRLLFGYSSLT